MINIINSKYFKTISLLASGSMIAQLITILCSPLLTRLYTKEELGIYSYILSVVSLFWAVMNLRYDMSIVTEEDEKNIFPLIKLSVFICVINSILITAGYLLYIFFIKNAYMSLGYTAFYVLILLMSYGIINILNSYNNRKCEYKTITSVSVIRSLCQNFGAVLFGLFHIGSAGLLLSYTVGQIFGIRKQFRSLRPILFKIIHSSKSDVYSVMIKHKKQPLFSTPALLANGFSYSSVTFFIEALFGIGITGYYSISVRLLGMPLALISGNVSKVFFESASREFNESGQFFCSFKKSFVFLLFIAIPMTIILMLFAPTVCEFVFGKGWGTAGRYVAILAPMFGLRLIVSALTPGLIIAGKQKTEFFLQIMFVTSSIICFIISKTSLFSVEIYLILIAITFFICYLLYLFAIYKFSKKTIKI